MVVPPLSFVPWRAAHEFYSHDAQHPALFILQIALHRVRSIRQIGNATMNKSELRKQLRVTRRNHVTKLPDKMRGLIFRHPPGTILNKIKTGSKIGLYHETDYEAPTSAYATFFKDAGHEIALPFFTSRTAPMEFRLYSDPEGKTDLELGPIGLLQPTGAGHPVVPDVLFVPLIGFTKNGDRLGQGGGHYDIWLADHPGRIAIGLAWDVQLCEALPIEPHDIKLDAVITPTRIYGTN